MKFRSILIAVAALAAAAFLYSQFYNQIPLGRLSPFFTNPTPRPTLAELSSANVCAAQPERGVTLKSKLPIDFNAAVGRFDADVQARTDAGTTGRVNDILFNEVGLPFDDGATTLWDFYRVKRDVSIADAKIDATYGHSRAAAFTRIGTVGSDATDASIRGQGIYWMYVNYTGSPVFMMVLVQKAETDQKLSGWSGATHKYDVYIAKAFEEKYGKLPDLIMNPVDCNLSQEGGGTGGPDLAQTTFSEENCGATPAPVTAGTAPALFKPDPTADPNFTPDAINFPSASALMASEYVLVSAGSAAMPPVSKNIGKYKVGTDYYDVYFFPDAGTAVFLKKGAQVLMYDFSNNATNLDLTSATEVGDKQKKGGFYLCTIKFASATQAWSWFTPLCKPAVYLYPEQEQLVNVKVAPKGPFTYTDPVYPEGTGWTTLAKPNGDLKYGDRTLDYLYYEARIPTNLIAKPTQGWVLGHNELPAFYSDILPKLGLNVKEADQFKVYWEKYLPDTGKKYFVGLVAQENLDQIEPMTIEPKPDNLIRVRFYFRPAAEGETAVAPTIATPSRAGFDVMDWGGVVEGVDGFSCVQ